MRVSINALGVDGPYLRDGFCVPGTDNCFGYFLDENDGLYHLTHLPSGFLILALATEKDAVSVGVVVYEAMGVNASAKDSSVAASSVSREVRVLLMAAQRVTFKMGARVST